MNPRRFFMGRAAGFLVVLAIFAVVFYFWGDDIRDSGEGRAIDHKNASYMIAGASVQLVEGVAETEAAPGSAAKVITTYFGNELRTDLNGDGREDVVFLLTQNTGGSGTFYYVVAALNTEEGYVGSEGLLLGDRIAPQTTEKGTGKIVIVNYADRAPGEPFSTDPSVGKSIWLILDISSMQFGEVQQNFEGEADPSRMTLGMKEWIWDSALFNDGRELKPDTAGEFTLTFGAEGRFTADTDCNQMGGTYVVSGDQITFSDIFMTKMFCESSQEADFAALLETTSGYHFTSRGQLILDLKFDSGSAVFR